MKKLLIGIGAFIVLVAFISAVSGDGDDTEEVAAAPTATAQDIDEQVTTASEPEQVTTQPEANDNGSLALGETARLGDYEISVTEFTADATDKVMNQNEFNEEPENGFYAIVTLDATYLGDDEGMPGFDLTATLVVDGVQHSDHECQAAIENSTVDAPTLESGGTAQGINFCIDHPGLESGGDLFIQETISLDRERIYWDIS